jgi:hypothetical protein
VSNALGLIAFIGYVLATIGAAAGVTWVVVRLTPHRKADSSAGS